MTMADEDTNLILTDDASTIGQFGVDGRHLESKLDGGGAVSW